MAYLVDRLKERTSQASIAVALTAVSQVAVQPAAWAPGALPLWLTLIPTLTPCLIAILVPEAHATPAVPPIMKAGTSPH